MAHTVSANVPKVTKGLNFNDDKGMNIKDVEGLDLQTSSQPYRFLLWRHPNLENLIKSMLDG